MRLRDSLAYPHAIRAARAMCRRHESMLSTHQEALMVFATFVHENPRFVARLAASEVSSTRTMPTMRYCIYRSQGGSERHQRLGAFVEGEAVAVAVAVWVRELVSSNPLFLSMTLTGCTYVMYASGLARCSIHPFLFYFPLSLPPLCVLERPSFRCC